MKNQDEKIALELTKDGSHTLFSARFQSHYHSTHGAIQESEHVFIQECLKRAKTDTPRVLEIGFGTGLNALLTLMECHDSSIQVEYHGYEAYPLNSEIAAQLNYCELLGRPEFDALFEQMHTSLWNEENHIGENFKLKKVKEDFQSAYFEGPYDCVYFDAFGPGSQPELWDGMLFQRIYDSMSPGGVLSTYSSKGDVRRALQSIGFEVEKVPGPPGKREMLVAIK